MRGPSSSDINCKIEGEEDTEDENCEEIDSVDEDDSGGDDEENEL